jgi:hypothetical protein
MAIRVKCSNPACGKEHAVAAELAGKMFTCDACRRSFQVPFAAKVAGADAPTVKLPDAPAPVCAKGASASGGQSAMPSPAVPLNPEP